MNAPKLPPRAEPGAFRLHRFTKVAQIPMLLVIAFDFVLESFQHPRNSAENGNAFALCRLDDFGRIQTVLKNNRRSEDPRDKNAYHLAEDMAERQNRENLERMNEELPSNILIDLAFYRGDVCKEIFVG